MTIKAINTIYTDYHSTYELVVLTGSIALNIAAVLLICVRFFFL